MSARSYSSNQSAYGEGRLLAIDVGGTTTKMAWFTPDCELIGHDRVPTPRDSTGLSLARLIAQRAIGTETAGTVTSPTLAVGVAVPGIADTEKGIVIEAVNLGWKMLPIKELIESELAVAFASRPVPVLAFAHDVRAGGVAEAQAAQAPDHELLAFIAIGTGISAAFVHGKQLVLDHLYAGEIGQVVGANGLRLEEVSAASTVARRLGVKGAKEAAELVRAGNPGALRVWREAVEGLAEAIAWMRATLGITTVILGGGLAESGSLLNDPLTRCLATRCGTLGAPRLRNAHYGELAGLYGAALLAQRALNTSVPSEGNPYEY